MWRKIANFVLRQRLWIVILISIITVFMGYMASKVSMSYDFAQMLPDSHPTSKAYKNFKNQFGEEGSIIFIGTQNHKLFTPQYLNAWGQLSRDLKKIDGVEGVLSIANIVDLKKDTTTNTFKSVKLINGNFETQQQVDEFKLKLSQMKVYDKLIYNLDSNSTLIMVTLNKDKVNTKGRINMIHTIYNECHKFEEAQNDELHYSGMPYIRTIMAEKIKHEIILFVILAFIITSLALLAFFRSLKVITFPMIIVLISVLWAVGLMGILNYKITILTGIIPTLIIIIAVENCIFLINKYHYEYRSHGNKVKSITRLIMRIGKANLMTNVCTALGFAAFIVTRNKLLVEFGIVSSICILLTYVLSLALTPIVFSYMPPPTRKQLYHLNNKVVTHFLGKIKQIVLYHRRWIYGIAIALFLIGCLGITLLRTEGHVVDDIPHKDKLYTDLMFFERQIHGVLPFEVSIDTKKDKGITKLSFMKRVDKFQTELSENNNLSRPLSLIEAVKFGKQAFYNGNPEYYTLPDNNELAFMADYLPQKGGAKGIMPNILNGFMDSTMSKTRISFQIANLSAKEIAKLHDSAMAKAITIFDTTKYDVKITGTSVVFADGNKYMTHNLIESFIIALLSIALLMALLFSSLRMIIISLIPNLLPQILVIAIMGIFDVPIKYSTILVFSIALGISVDNTIQFLARYRLELRATHWNIKDSVMYALGETGYSMFYSSTILSLGFVIFTLSSFGGTQAIGLLISVTLFLALLCNLFFLPALLLSFEKVTSKRLHSPIISTNESDKVELEDIELEKKYNQEHNPEDSEQ